MKIQTVKSNAIDVVGYDDQTHKLRVSFRHDKPKEFCHVPEKMFNDFINARSKNRFYKRHIQDSFPC